MGRGASVEVLRPRLNSAARHRLPAWPMRLYAKRALGSEDWGAPVWAHVHFGSGTSCT